MSNLQSGRNPDGKKNGDIDGVSWNKPVEH